MPTPRERARPAEIFVSICIITVRKRIIATDPIYMNDLEVYSRFRASVDRNSTAIEKEYGKKIKKGKDRNSEITVEGLPILYFIR
jgi:hypothetical protein